MDNNISSSVESISGSISCDKHYYTDKEIEALAISVNDLKDKVKELICIRLTEATSAPVDVVNAEVRKYMRKKYKLGRPPLESEIRDAISKTKDMKHAAEYLGISKWTLKNYCRLYDQNNSSGGATPLPLWQPRRGPTAVKSKQGDKAKSFFNFKENY